MTTSEMKTVLSSINRDNTNLAKLITIYENEQMLELSSEQMNKLKNKTTRLKEDIINKLDSLPF